MVASLKRVHMGWSAGFWRATLPASHELRRERRVAMRHILPWLTLALIGLAACSSSSSTTTRTVDRSTLARPSDHFRERIVHVNDAVDGPVVVDFEYSQRRFVIDPVASPDHARMIQFAKAAQVSGKPVYATVAPTGTRTKGDDGPPFVLMRLADTPDPAAPAR